MGKTLFPSKKVSKKSKHSKQKAASKKSQAKETSPDLEEHPKRYSPSMTAPASTNPSIYRDATYAPYDSEQNSTLDPYTQSSMQAPHMVKTVSRHNNSYPSVHTPNYTSTQYAINDNYTGSNTYYQQTFQPQGHDPYPAQQPSMTDPFYANGAPYASSPTIPKYSTEAEDHMDQYQDRSPQLQIWAEETSDMNLPVNERLVRSNWE